MVRTKKEESEKKVKPEDKKKKSSTTKSADSNAKVTKTSNKETIKRTPKQSDEKSIKKTTAKKNEASKEKNDKKTSDKTVKSTKNKSKPLENPSVEHDSNKKTKTTGTKKERKAEVEKTKDVIDEIIVDPKTIKRRRRAVGTSANQIAVCSYCKQEALYIVKERLSTVTYKDVNVEYNEKYAVCATCGAELYVPALVSENKQEIESAYKKTNKKKKSEADKSEDIAKELAKATVSSVRASRSLKKDKNNPVKVDSEHKNEEIEPAESLVEPEEAKIEVSEEKIQKNETKNELNEEVNKNKWLKDSDLLGSRFKYSKMEFVVLRDYGDSVLAVTTKPLNDVRMEFHDHVGKNINNWTNCSLRKWLNTEFIQKMNKEDLMMIETDLTADTGETEYGTCEDYVSLPWTSLLRESFYIMPEYEFWTWTVTPFAVSVWEGKMSCTIGYHKAIYNEKVTTMLNIAPMIRIKKDAIKIM